MHKFKKERASVSIIVKGRGILNSKNISTPSGQALAAYIVEMMPQVASVNLDADSMPPAKMSFQFKKKLDIALTSPEAPTAGQPSTLSEEKPVSESSDSKPKKRKGRPKGSKNRNWDALEVTGGHLSEPDGKD